MPNNLLHHLIAIFDRKLELLAGIHIERINFIVINSTSNPKIEAKVIDRKSSIKNAACEEIPTYISLKNRLKKQIN